MFEFIRINSKIGPGPSSQVFIVFVWKHTCDQTSATIILRVILEFLRTIIVEDKNVVQGVTC